MSRWSYEKERAFMEIAASSKSFDQVVKRTRRPPRAVRKAAMRLGVKLGKQIASNSELEKMLRERE